MKKVEVPANVKTIGENAFAEISNFNLKKRNEQL